MELQVKMRCVAITIVLLAISSSAIAHDSVVKRGIVYNDSSGRPMRLDLYLPLHNDAPRPAIILIHGGSWLFGTRHQLHWYARKLAAKGYVTATVTYRMMPRYGFPACLYDCKAAVRFLRDNALQYGIDPNRIGAMGNSAGGHLAAMLATTKPSDGLEGDTKSPAPSNVQAAVVLYGVTDLGYYRAPKGYISLFGFARKFVRSFLSKSWQPEGDPYVKASPINYVSGDTCPTLVIHGTKDHQVPYAQAVDFYARLQKAGVPSQLITTPYGHAFDFLHPKARAMVYPEILAFIDKHLKGQAEQKTEPQKAGAR
jgi:acetyl esterase/lipase